MVQAIQKLLKNMTRRLNGLQDINKEPDNWTFIKLDFNPKGQFGAIFQSHYLAEWIEFVKCPWQPGDRLWVRETWYYEEHMHELTNGEPDLPNGEYSHRYIYRASSPDYPVDVGVGSHGWKPSIFMPKVATRIWLEVVNVRVERLQDITYDDCLSEGMWNYGTDVDTLAAYQDLWQKLNAKRGYGWGINPWVWVIEFKRLEAVG
jgi:hypothetical protein